MKRIVSLITVLVILAGVLIPGAMHARAATGDEIRAPKKIISVVYDDSESMFGDRWVYASYAMQALIAQLNEQDVLYITYMSRYGTATRIELTDLKKAVKNVRNWMHAANTPVGSIDTAVQALKDTAESDPSTQFWCVVMTDGDFNNMDCTIQEKLNSYKGITMSNGSVMNMAYLAMGAGAIRASSDHKGGLYTYEAKDDREIADTMAQISNLISGRLTADDVEQVDEKTISFRSELPIYSISILSQRSSVTVVSAEGTEQPLDVERNIELYAYDTFGQTKTKLYGNAAVVTGSGNVIQPGTYTITFSEAVDKGDLLVQYEPAIGMKLMIEKDGTELSDTSGLKIDDKVSVSMVPVNPATGERIEEKDLPAGISWRTEYIVDGKEADAADKDHLKGIRLLEGENTIRGTMQIPGFAPSVYEVWFKLEPIVYNFGIQVEQPDPLTYYRKNAGSGSVEGTSLIFRITNDGVPLTAEELDGIGLKLKTADIVCDDSEVEEFYNRIGNILATCIIRRNEDGSFTLTPVARAPFTAFLMKAGVYTVTVELNKDPTITAQGTFLMVGQLMDWIDLIGLLIVIALICCLIYAIFFKYKFNNQTIYYEVYQLAANGRGSVVAGATQTYLLKRFMPNTFWPFKRATEANICGLTFRAGPGGSIIITGKSIAKKVVRYGANSSNPTTSLRVIVTAMRPVRRKIGDKETVVATDQSLSKGRPIYFQSYQNDTMIWRISLNK